MRARREVVTAVAKRYRSSNRSAKGRVLDELCATTGWHRKHAVRALRQHEPVTEDVEALRERKRRYGATIKDALTALWEASDRVCGKRLKLKGRGLAEGRVGEHLNEATINRLGSIPE